MKTIKDKVKALLVKFPNLRDDDYNLIATFYYYEIGGAKVNSMTGFQVLEELAKGKLTSSESIRRVRQKLQEEHPELRGKNYKRRQSDAEETKQKIGEL
jgi:hypothetical protein